MSSDLLVTVEMLDERGEVVEERVVTMYRRLLEAAHADGLSKLETTVIELPTRDNHDTAVVRASVTTKRGTFTGIGDASPANVPQKLKAATVRVAETRASCRAMRAALGVGHVAVEELTDTVRFKRDDGRRAEAPAPRPMGAALPERSRGRDDRPQEAAPDDRRAMSDDQRKLVFRLCFDLGATKQDARDHVLEALGVDRLEHATRIDASRAIENLKREVAARAGRHQNGAGAHGGG
jgi:hypothetical protein